jgi:DNA-binding CsgD family transcriptional regulator
MRTSGMTARHAEARLRQLCCLGLGGQAVMPTLLQSLHALIPSRTNHFFWASEDGEIGNSYMEAAEELELLPLYFAEFYNREAEVGSLPFAEKMRRVPGVHADPAPEGDPRTIYNSDFYNGFLRPLRIHHALGAVIRAADGRALGLLRLARAERQPSFSLEEHRRLARLAPFVAHALEDVTHDPVETAVADGEDTGLLIVDMLGKPVHISSRARALLRLAGHSRIAPGQLWNDDVHRAIARICRRLAAVSRHEPGSESQPEWSCRNSWGGFVFRAHWLQKPLDPEPEALVPGQLIGVTIRHREPLPLALMRRMQHLPLPDRQMQVCLSLAAGHSLRVIGERMGVTRHTVDYHCRELYARFDVSSRHELIGKLLSASSP